jgi:hypothetical protein
MLTIYGFSGYGMEPVEPISTFATVLHLPDSEEIWPGEWVKQFPQRYFATQHNDSDSAYLARGSVEEHMRYELLRMTKGAHFPEGCHEWLYTQSLAFHRWALNEWGLAYEALGREKSSEEISGLYLDYDNFIDVEDFALDESMIVELSPQRPVGLTIPLGKLPTEQEDN